MLRAACPTCCFAIDSPHGLRQVAARVAGCQFNDRTKTLLPETPVPTIVTPNPKDRSFTFVTKTPPVSYFLKKAAGVQLGSKGGEKIGSVTLAQVYEIAKVKKSDPSLAHIPLENLCKSIIGSARSMGITVVAE